MARSSSSLLASVMFLLIPFTKSLGSLVGKEGAASATRPCLWSFAALGEGRWAGPCGLGCEEREAAAATANAARVARSSDLHLLGTTICCLNIGMSLETRGSCRKAV